MGHGSGSLAHILLSYQNSIIRHKLRDKIMTHFKMVTTEHEAREHWPSITFTTLPFTLYVLATQLPPVGFCNDYP